MRAGDLVGAWELLDFEISRGDGLDRRHPLGEKPRGRIIYTPQGQMSAILSRGDRAPLQISGMEDAHRAPLEQRAEAFDSCLSYAGTYRLEGDRVVHSVLVATVPNIVGTEQVRTVALEGELLLLSYRVTGRSHRSWHSTLRWKRACPSELAIESGSSPWGQVPNESSALDGRLRSGRDTAEDR